jgi:hypothetical protein
VKSLSADSSIVARYLNFGRQRGLKTRHLSLGNPITFWPCAIGAAGCAPWPVLRLLCWQYRRPADGRRASPLVAGSDAVGTRRVTRSVRY